MNIHKQTPREYARECVDTMDEDGIKEVERWSKTMMYAACNFGCPEWQRWFADFERHLRRMTV